MKKSTLAVWSWWFSFLAAVTASEAFAAPDVDAPAAIEKKAETTGHHKKKHKKNWKHKTRGQNATSTTENKE